jgi:hypothetical protein
LDLNEPIQLPSSNLPVCTPPPFLIKTLLHS